MSCGGTLSQVPCCSITQDMAVARGKFVGVVPKRVGMKSGWSKGLIRQNKAQGAKAVQFSHGCLEQNNHELTKKPSSSRSIPAPALFPPIT